MSTPLWAVGIVLGGTVVGAYGSILLKKGSDKLSRNIPKQLKNWRLFVGISLFIISSVIYLVALQYGELSVLYPLGAASYVWVALLSKKLLNERLNQLKIIGISLIIIGIVIITL